jgi:hypothetical protein
MHRVRRGAMDLPHAGMSIAVGAARVTALLLVVMDDGHLATEHPIRPLQAACGHLQEANRRWFARISPYADEPERRNDRHFALWARTRAQSDVSGALAGGSMV